MAISFGIDGSNCQRGTIPLNASTAALAHQSVRKLKYPRRFSLNALGDNGYSPKINSRLGRISD